MTGELEKDSHCPLCRGRLTLGVKTVPFIFPETIVLIKDVPAEICSSCHEPYTTGEVTDRLTDLLNPLRSLRTEVSIVSYKDVQLASSS
jgi:YgiT-type zinc finger domain-containing protein